ncbi:MAG: alpha-1,2-fucosyltransferase [Bacteroidetes bacterium]|nr:alpha-1,2-fucosyltransferase [Bacteroidota bacterium]
MIIVKLKGGLGNQMFQYAFGKCVAQLLNQHLYLDLSFFEDQEKREGHTPRHYELGILNIHARILEKKQLEKLGANFDLKSRIKCAIKSKFNTVKIKEKKTLVNISGLSKMRSYYFDGYFQNEKYFAQLTHKLKKDFLPKEPLDQKTLDCIEKISSQNAVSIHIRRGDYISDNITNAHHGTCGIEYYQRAIKLISEQVENPHFYIFSDDIEWVNEHFKTGHPQTVITDYQQTNNFIDIVLMSHCKHHIVANSSFSWWGAWLGRNDKKIVIAPKDWFVEGGKEIACKNWIKI